MMKIALLTMAILTLAATGCRGLPVNQTIEYGSYDLIEWHIDMDSASGDASYFFSEWYGSMEITDVGATIDLYGESRYTFDTVRKSYYIPIESLNYTFYSESRRVDVEVTHETSNWRSKYGFMKAANTGTLKQIDGNG